MVPPTVDLPPIVPDTFSRLGCSQGTVRDSPRLQLSANAAPISNCHL
jgi:hypothetical protein